VIRCCQPFRLVFSCPEIMLGVLERS
jgi:hypothetical protein